MNYLILGQIQNQERPEETRLDAFLNKHYRQCNAGEWSTNG